MSTYVALNEFQDYGRNELAGSDDLLLQSALDAAEEMINEYCQRSFAVASVTATARQYTPHTGIEQVLRIHDCIAVTSVVENGATVDSSGYTLEPLNALGWSGQAIPYQQLRRYTGAWAFDYGKPTVTVTARWGWAATPEAVRTATLIIAKDIAQQRNTMAGVAGFGEFGAVRVRMNPIAVNLLTPLRRVEAFGIA